MLCKSKNANLLQVHKEKIRAEYAAHPKHHFNQEQMLNLFARGSVYIGASRTDEISTSALEAINQGALPIQTNTSCIGNLISDGVTGFTPSPKEDELYEALISALELIRGDNKFMEIQGYSTQELHIRGSCSSKISLCLRPSVRHDPKITGMK